MKFFIPVENLLFCFLFQRHLFLLLPPAVLDWKPSLCSFWCCFTMEASKPWIQWWKSHHFSFLIAMQWTENSCNVMGCNGVRGSIPAEVGSVWCMKFVTERTAVFMWRDNNFLARFYSITYGYLTLPLSNKDKEALLNWLKVHVKGCTSSVKSILNLII